MALTDTVERNVSHILQWFASKLNNAVPEEVDSRIARFNRDARGFSDVENLI